MILSNDPCPPLLSIAALSIAAFEVITVRCTKAADGNHQCLLELRSEPERGNPEIIEARHADQQTCIALVVSQICIRPICLWKVQAAVTPTGEWQVVVAVRTQPAEMASDGALSERPEAVRLPGERMGTGRFVGAEQSTATVIAALRAANHAGLLKPAYRANYQKFLRDWANQAADELAGVVADAADPAWRQLEMEAVLLEYFNRVASAAVVTAANSPRPESILSLFDNSAWLFDEQGRRRDAYTDTGLWLAWYPGVENDQLMIDDVINSMPAAPDSAIPSVVRLFENPSSWLRFRGAVDLEDHDILHVLLGRGLQDQDEAFVLGFAMGTSKRISWLQYWIFRWVVTRLYPEPYRIPRFLLPAFELGVQCGRETGTRELYRQPLKRLRGLTVGQAREAAGIDMEVVRSYFQQERQRIPFTIASLRLPPGQSGARCSLAL